MSIELGYLQGAEDKLFKIKHTGINGYRIKNILKKDEDNTKLTTYKIILYTDFGVFDDVVADYYGLEQLENALDK